MFRMWHDVCVYLVTQSCLCYSMDCSLPGFYVHGILQHKNTGVGCHFFLQRIFPTKSSNLHLLHWQADSLPLSHLESPMWHTFKLLQLN